jgi:cobalt-zinc-cadmium efflux system outer membrane protein
MVRSLLAICIVVLLTGCGKEFSVENVQSSESPPIKINNRPSAETVDEISVVNVKETDAALTLRDALSLTVMHNPVLKAYSHVVRAAEARQLQAGLWNNPEFEYELEDFGGIGNFKGTDSAESTIGLNTC